MAQGGFNKQEGIAEICSLTNAI